MIKFLLLLILLCSCGRSGSGGKRTTHTHPNVKFNHILAGLPFFSQNNGRLARLPLAEFTKYPQAVQMNALNPAGARISFKTKATSMTVRAKTGVYSFSVYVNGKFAAQGNNASTSFNFSNDDKKNITIYLPGAVDRPFEFFLEGIDLVGDQKAEAYDGLKSNAPIVYYGSSITQSLSTTEPGAVFSSVASRDNKFDFVNLGMSGSGLGEPVMAETMAKIPASLYVLDFWANPPTQMFIQRLPVFVNLLLKLRPNTPILITTPILNTAGHLPIENRDKYNFIVNFVRSLNARNIKMHDWFSVLHPSDLADGRHPNNIGHIKLGKSINKTICQMLSCN